MYAIAFGLGVGVCNLLGPRMKLSLVPLAFAGAFAGIATIIALHNTANPLDVLNQDGTLDYPLGYRNANAAFFAIAMFPALGLASDRDLDWRARALALGATTLCIDFALLSQSRASVPAMVLALIVYVIASPHRVRALSWLALAALPAVGMVPALTDLFHAASAAGDTLRGVNDEMQGCASAAAITSLAAIALGAAAAYFENGPTRAREPERPWQPGRPRRPRRARRDRRGRLHRRRGQPDAVDLGPLRRVPPQRLAGPLAELEPLRRQPRLEPLRHLEGRRRRRPRRAPARRRRRRLRVLLPPQPPRRAPEPARRPQRGARAALGAGHRGLRALRHLPDRRDRRRAARPKTRALRGRARGHRARERDLLARPHLGRLVLAVPGGDRAGDRAARRRRRARGAHPGAARRPAVASRRRDRRARGARAEHGAAVPGTAVRERRLRELAHRSQPCLRRPRPGAVAQQAHHPARPRRGLDRAARPATASGR